MGKTNFEEWLMQHRSEFAQVVPFEAGDKLLRMDFTESNTELTDEVVNDTIVFIKYINQKLADASARYGIGGYGENRTIYRRSSVFDATSQPPKSPEGGLANSLPSLHDDSALLTASSQTKGSGKNSFPVKPDKTFGYHWADPSLYQMLQEYALQNRANPTQAENVLWEAINAKKLGPYKFRRQFIIDKYIADLVCLDRRLVIEVDGAIHQLPENKAGDEIRTIELNKKGFSVLRFTNNEVLYHLEKTLQTISAELNTRQSIQESSDLSSPFGGQGAARSLHLGIDIWGKPYTKVMAPLNGIVHSFAFNNAYGDYGATIILTHNLEGESFHTLYGHLSLNSIKNLHEGDAVKKGDVIAEFGIPFENGQWPPHLHFQIIKDMQGKKGDYPGVCAVSERETYLANCPDADSILGMMQDSF
jgi:very-short-patch-repair endonuclease